jgi:hypothetical protein
VARVASIQGSEGVARRGTAVAGIVVAIFGMLFCTFLAIGQWIVNSDTNL